MWTALRLVLWVIALAVLAPRPARADGPRVHVRIAAQAGEREALLRVLPELMQRLSVELVVEPASDARLLRKDAGTFLATCLFDLRAPDEAVLYVHDPARDRILERRVAREAGGEELVREELGHMLLAAVEALLAGATLGAPSAEVQVPETALPVMTAPAPAPALAQAAPVQAEPEAQDAGPSARDGFRLNAAIFYEVAALGHAPGVTHGPAVALEAQSPLPLALGVLLSVQYRLPFEVEPDPIGMRSQTFALRALATIERTLGTRLGLRFGLGAGADLTRITPRLESNARIVGTEARTLTLAVARALVAIDLRVARALSLWAALAADVDLDRSQYVVVESGGSESSAIEPWRIHPALLIGAALP